jgi:hypothetical protein
MDDTLWLQISSGSGPEECAHAAAHSGLRHNHYELERGNPIRIFEE